MTAGIWQLAAALLLVPLGTLTLAQDPTPPPQPPAPPPQPPFPPPPPDPPPPPPHPRARVPPNRDKLAVVVLFAFPRDQAAHRSVWLLQCLTKLASNVLPWTPLRVMLWLNHPLSPNVTAYLHQELKGNIEFLKLRPEEWDEADPPHIRKELRNRRRGWNQGGYSLEFRRTGAFMATTPFHYAHLHGYQYVMKLDDDASVDEPVQTNILEALRAKDTEFAYKDTTSEVWAYLAGLAELTRYYITSSGILPTMLYEDCNPASIDGLFYKEGDDAVSASAEARKGWQGRLFSGSMMVFKTELLMRLEVREFLRLCLESGGFYRNRWGDQAVLSMVPLLFVPKEKMHKFGWAFAHVGSKGYLRHQEHQSERRLGASNTLYGGFP